MFATGENTGKPWKKAEKQNPDITLHAGIKRQETKRGPPPPPKPYKYRKPRVRASEHYAKFDEMFEAELKKCEKEQKTSKLPWRLDVSVYIERPPTLTDEPEDWELEYEEVCKEREAATTRPLPEGLFPLQSVYPELEEEAMRIVQERRELREAGKPEEQYDFQGRYAQEIEDLVNFHEFEWPTRETKADRDNDRRSTKRRGDQILYLIFQNANKSWNFAQGRILQRDGSVRAAAERHVKAKCGPEFEVYFPGNAPMGFHFHPLDPKRQKKASHYGVKEFLMRGIHMSGDLDLDFALRQKGKRAQIVDYAWVAADELPEYFADKDRMEYLSQLLL